MAKRNRGIIELTATEEQTLSPLEKHLQVSHLIPFQGADEMRLVRLKNVHKYIKMGWVLKKQNQVHEIKVNLALAIHKAVTSKKISVIKAAALIRDANEATAETIRKVKKQIEGVLESAGKSKLSLLAGIISFLF